VAAFIPAPTAVFTGIITGIMCRADTDNAGTDKVGTKKVGTARANTARVNTDRANTDKVGTDKVGTDTVGTRTTAIKIRQRAARRPSEPLWNPSTNRLLNPTAHQNNLERSMRRQKS
jgi:hypothetical protein